MNLENYEVEINYPVGSCLIIGATTFDQECGRFDAEIFLKG
ncbi:MAG: hypothetical protein Q8J76_12660 [Desulfobulbaceae bacterium]|nr:hypothetical protein [Desulfobulbaceae bacterium]